MGIPLFLIENREVGESMQHYAHIDEEDKEKIFFKQPGTFNKYTPKEKLAYALGAALYIPAVHPKLSQYLITKKYRSLMTLIICLEDGIADDEVEQAEKMLAIAFDEVEEAIINGQLKEEELPLLFIRTRSTVQLQALLKQEKMLHYISGFSLPKFNSIEGYNQLQLIKAAGLKHGESLYAMPILETKQIIDLQTRMEELFALKGLLDADREMILNVRIGATDFSGIYGIRRNIDTTIYDISILRDCITSIINVFGKAEDDYVLSGPVWEFFSNHSRLLKPALRQTPFKRYGEEGKLQREHILHKAEDGLIKELILDKVNGLCGKTIIHPSHITYVNALQVITREEYEDAMQIVSTASCGVIKSKQSNKMNEIKPHTNWANKILKRAEIYGVLNDDEDYTCLF